VNSVRLTVTLCLLFIAVVVGMFVYTTTRPTVLSEAQLREQGVFILPRPREIAPFELEGADGSAFTLADLEGRWSYLFFGFTNCPDICPTSMADLAEAERRLRQQDPELAERFQGVLVSVDPERDTREKLEQYVTAFSPRFLGARGSRAEIAELGTQLNVAFARVPADDGGYQVDHSANIVIVNPRGHYHGFVKLPHSADTLVATHQSLSATL